MWQDPSVHSLLLLPEIAATVLNSTLCQAKWERENVAKEMRQGPVVLCNIKLSEKQNSVVLNM